MYDEHALHFLLRSVQSGVVARWQLLELGGTDNDIERMLRRRELAQVHPGVYVDHTGPLTRKQREWAALLLYWPAALALESALAHLGALPVPPREVQVAVADWRRLKEVPGTRIQLVPQFEQRCELVRRPPHVHLEHALIDVMELRMRDEDVAGAFALLAQVCGSRRTLPEWVERALADRRRVTGRKIIEGLVADRRDGLCSVLERGYRDRVERPHGFPRRRRQRVSRSTGGRTEQDVNYEEQGVIVELDGRTFHDDPEARDRDAMRDLAELATADAVTARVTYGLVFRDQCRTAHWIAQILRRHGWTGTPRRCPRCPD